MHDIVSCQLCYTVACLDQAISWKYNCEIGLKVSVQAGGMSLHAGQQMNKHFSNMLVCCVCGFSIIIATSCVDRGYYCYIFGFSIVEQIDV